MQSMLDARDVPPPMPQCISSLQQAQRLLLFKQTVDHFDGLYLPVFRYTAVVDFIHHHVQTGSTQHKS